MRTRYIFMLTLCAAAIATFGSGLAGAQDRNAARPQGSPGIAPGGTMLRTLQRGEWECALPGDAGGKAYQVVEAEGFRIGNASSYRNPQGRGIYLMRGDELVFTRGPKTDEKFRRLGDNMLQKLNPDGSTSRLICTRVSGSG
ncbi:elongation factor P [Erythrobacter sp. NFXS35]|uniref:elongation factor P n=1 Tax=Erythrobacter sp. NFXS35 TaxID=2818436 RepID=UPI0032DE7200